VGTDIVFGFFPISETSECLDDLYTFPPFCKSPDGKFIGHFATRFIEFLSEELAAGHDERSKQEGAFSPDIIHGV